MDNRQLTQTPPASLPVAPTPNPIDLPGLETLEERDRKLPFVTIIYQNTRVDGGGFKPVDFGKLVNSLTGEVKESIEMIVLKATAAQKRFPEEFERTRPLCQSDNGIKAREPNGQGFDGRPTDICAHCVYSQWGPNHEPPQCSRGYNYIAIDVADGLPFMVSMFRTSAATGKKLNTMWASRGYTTSFILSAKEASNSEFSYYVYSAKPGAPIPPEEQALYAALANRYRNVVAETDDEASVAGAGAGYSAEPPF